MPRIAFLFNYPLADKTLWKQQLVRSLRGKHEMVAVFGKTRPIDYVRTYLRMRQEDNVKDVPLPPSDAPRERTVAVMKEAGIPVKQVASVNSEACAEILRDFRPDYVVTALDHLLSRRIISTVPTVLNVHYGVLPEVKGWNATEWSLLETGRLSVSLHKVVWPVDAGDIFMTRDIEVEPTDGMGSLREKCQAAAVELYAEFFCDPMKYEKSAKSGLEGKTYYVMNRVLKQQVLDQLRTGRFGRSSSPQQ